MESMLGLYRHLRTARRMDEWEVSLARRGEAAFQLSGGGHEGSAALAPHLGPQDWLHPHYRDKALLLARGVTAAQYLHGLLATAESDSLGRRMPPFQCDPSLNILSPPTLVGNNALQAVGVAMSVRDRPGRPIVLCAIGDGGTQEGEFLEALAEAARGPWPALFVIEDNHYALSTPTAGRTFYDGPGGPRSEFLGLPIRRLDGADVPACVEAFGGIVAAMREDRAPRIVVLDVERLHSHSNSDDQTVYRSEAEIRGAREGRDPVARFEAWLAERGVPPDRLDGLHREVDDELRRALDRARAAKRPPLGPVKRPLPETLRRAAAEYRGRPGAPERTLLEAIRETLKNRLAADPRVWLYGQDIEDPKGDVFGITRGLSTAFPGRVVNAPLSESTIVGAAAGRALAGDRPVAFLQFADFYPLAFNQLTAEIGAMYWRTAGRWECPVIVMAVTGGYRAGLGPYHAQSPEATLARVPGLDVLMPSNAADAAGLLNAAFESGRPTVFLYPKNLLNERHLMTSADLDRHLVPPGRARVARAGRDLTLVGWGNTVALCERAAEALAKAGAEAEVLDLRSLSPWDREGVAASAARTGRLLVAHEDTATCGLGAEILAAVAESSRTPLALARVATPDTYVPYAYDSQLEVLPSFRSILARAAELLDLDLRWERPAAETAGGFTVKAIGSSPSDETVRIVEWRAKAGDAVKEGQVLADVEADKAAFEISSPLDGTLEEILVEEAGQVEVGTPIARLTPAPGAKLPAAAAAPEETPVLRRRRAKKRREAAAPAGAGADVEVVLSSICSALGSREMRNSQFLDRFPEWDAQDVVQRTGIERRFWIDEGESALSLAVRASRELLEREALRISDIDVLVCSTGTPPSMTPSLACRILKELSPEKGEVMVQAYDVNAACTGYLYALQNACDLLRSRPDSRVLVVTAETLSPVLDHRDPSTLFLFGDAATASLVMTRPGRAAAPVRIHRPSLSAKGEDERTLFVPCLGTGQHVHMEGQPVFRVAVRKMIEMLEQACAEAGIGVEDLAMVVPHQANTRIIEAIRAKIGIAPEKMFDHIRNFGNTSSNTIPLALQEVIPAQARGARLGLCAFGGGFTFGAAILDVL